MAGDALRSLQDDPQTNRKPLAGAVALSPCDVRPPDHVQGVAASRQSRSWCSKTAPRSVHSETPGRSDVLRGPPSGRSRVLRHLRDGQEPPDADPHVRWRGRREGNPPGDPIRLSCLKTTHPVREQPSQARRTGSDTRAGTIREALPRHRGHRLGASQRLHASRSRSSRLTEWSRAPTALNLQRNSSRPNHRGILSQALGYFAARSRRPLDGHARKKKLQAQTASTQTRRA